VCLSRIHRTSWWAAYHCGAAPPPAGGGRPPGHLAARGPRGPGHLQARAETVAVKPAFRRAFAKRRCIIPADGYFEWQAVTENGKQRKQPYYIYPKDGGALAFAGLYELWRDQALPDDHENAWLWTAAIITTQATDDVGQIHDRMPMVIAPDHWADWLNPGNSEPGQLQATMLPAMAGGLTSHPVSTAVNSVRNNGPELIVPLSADQERPPGELFWVRGTRLRLTRAWAAQRTRTGGEDTSGDNRRP
jgi:putative SOS response-associated peptidase YedK